MDPVQRERLQNRMLLLQYPKSILSMIIGFPMLAFLLVAGDIQIINEEWDNRNIVKGSAEIMRHTVTRHGATYGHDVRYKYVVGDEEFSAMVTIPSTSEAYFRIGATKFTPEIGSQLPVYYHPDSPSSPTLFDDASVTFWTSVKRLTCLLLIALTCVLIALLIVVFYRPKKSERYLPAKLGVPTPQIDIDEIKINT
jgi:hypothetical protein